MRDFTVGAYRQILDAIKTAGVGVFGVAKWVSEWPDCGILLRHDIDRKPRNALQIAQLENEYRMSSTYYFRMVKGVFQPDIIRQISELGHEIGYHYEDLSLAGGDCDKAKEFFSIHLEQLRAIAKVETIAMHGRPFSVYDNRELWKKFRFADFGVVAEAFLSIDYSDIYYFTDTGGTWGQTRANIRDHVKNGLTADVWKTFDLASFISQNTDKKIALVMHPERWESNVLRWIVQRATDAAANTAKIVIGGLRRPIAADRQRKNRI
jgi:hypothetical protein